MTALMERPNYAWKKIGLEVAGRFKDSEEDVGLQCMQLTMSVPTNTSRGT